jgi:hypothetical protein
MIAESTNRAALIKKLQPSQQLAAKNMIHYLTFRNTDVRAAMAECVMINKGDHTIKVIETLKDILQRTGGHHIKKRYTLRPLSIAERFIKSI